MKQGNSISSPSNCNCVNLQLHLLSIPNSLFSDRQRASIMSIIAFIALVASFSLKNLPISEKTFVLLLLGIGQDAIGQLESDIYRDTTIRPEIYELYDEENRRVLVIEVPSRPIGKVFKFEDVPLMRVGEDLKPMSDAMYLKILQESKPDFSEKICEGLTLDDLDEEAIRVMKKKYADRWEKPEKYIRDYKTWRDK